VVNSGQYCKTESPETETCLCFFYSSVYLWSIVVNSANSDPAKTRRANLPAAGRFAHGQKKDFHKNNCQFVPVCAGLCRFLPAGFCRFLPVSAGFCRFLPVCAGLCHVTPYLFFLQASNSLNPFFWRLKKLLAKMGGNWFQKSPPFPQKNLFLVSSWCYRIVPWLFFCNPKSQKLFNKQYFTLCQCIVKNLITHFKFLTLQSHQHFCWQNITPFFCYWDVQWVSGVN